MINRKISMLAFLAALATLIFSRVAYGQEQGITNDEENAFSIQAANAPIQQAEPQMVAVYRYYLPSMSQPDAPSVINASMALSDTNEIDFGPFNQRLVHVEMQAWWMPAYGHIHVAVVVPLGQTITGTLPIPIRIVLHDNPATLKQLRIDTDKGVFLKVPLGDLTCPGSVCAWSLTVLVDTTKIPNGWRELRFRAETKTPDGKAYLPSSGVPVYVKNGTSKDSNYNRFCNNTSLIGRGWYDGFGYSNAIIDCVPLAPVKGKITFRVRSQETSQRLIVDIDKSHFIPAVGTWPEQEDAAGTNVFDKAGDFQSWQNITIDTTTMANGWHSLAVRSVGPKGEISQCIGCPSGQSFPSGAAKIWFYVQN